MVKCVYGIEPDKHEAPLRRASGGMNSALLGLTAGARVLLRGLAVVEKTGAALVTLVQRKAHDIEYE